MIRTTIQPLPQPIRLVIVEDDIPRLLSLYEECWEKTKDQHELKGFRQGEIPRSVAEKKIGVEKIYKPIIDELAQEAIKKAKTNFCEIEDVVIEWQTDQKPLVIVIKGFLFPEVKKCNYKDLVTNFEKLLVIDEEVNSMLQKAAFSEADEHEIESLEEVKEEDLHKVSVLVNFIMDDVQEQKVLANQVDYRIDVTKTVYGFEPILKEHKEHKVGDVFEYKCSLPEDFFDAKLANREVSFQIKIVKIYTLQLPEIDDELAKKIGYKDLSEMRSMITQDLEENKQKTNEVLYRDHIMGLLVAQTEITPIPDSMIKRELDIMLKGAVTNANKLQETNLSVEDFLSLMKLTKEDWYISNWVSARKKLLGNLALQHIAVREGLEPTDEECESLLKEILPKDFDFDLKQVNAEGLKEYVLLKKAQDFLIEQIENKKGTKQ